MAPYGHNYGRSRAGMRGGYGREYGYGRGYSGQSRGFPDAPFQGGAWGGHGGARTGYRADYGPGYDRGFAPPRPFRPVARPFREEWQFQRERAARGEEFGRGSADYGGRRGGERGRGWGGEWLCAADIMTENPEAVTPDTPLVDVAKKMKELDVGIIPVVDTLKDRHLEGVITDRDITIRAVAEGKDGNAKVSDIMTRDVEACRPGDRIGGVMEVMRRQQVRRVPITDDEGCLVGIIAQADLAVDYAGHDRDRDVRVGETIEKISEPARPRRAGVR